MNILNTVAMSTEVCYKSGLKYAAILFSALYLNIMSEVGLDFSLS